MKIALFANLQKSQAKKIAIGIQEFLKAQKIEVYTEDEMATAMGALPLSQVPLEKINLIISLGGDGTILRIMHKHPEMQAPLLGINLGGLGFMADINVGEVFPALEAVIDKRFVVDERLMMEGETLHAEKRTAVNEIALHRGRNPCLIDLAIHVDGKYLNTFSADGIILSTPSGSTAYSMAAGGPILTPELQAFVLTPICPHTVSNRPIVFMPKEEVQVQYVSDHKPIEITFDGLEHYTMKTGEVLRIRPSKRKFRLVNLEHQDYFSTLRLKLGWTGKLRSH